jgi:hypothetical protein
VVRNAKFGDGRLSTSQPAIASSGIASRISIVRVCH